MMLIVAVVCPEKLGPVLSAMNGREVRLLSVCPVVTAGRGSTEIYRGREVPGPQHRLRVEVAANDDAVDGAIEAIAAGAGEGGRSGGEVFVVRLHEYAAFRDGERDAVALGPRTTPHHAHLRREHAP